VARHASGGEDRAESRGSRAKRNAASMGKRMKKVWIDVQGSIRSASPSCSDARPSKPRIRAIGVAARSTRLARTAPVRGLRTITGAPARPADPAHLQAAGLARVESRRPGARRGERGPKAPAPPDAFEQTVAPRRHAAEQPRQLERELARAGVRPRTWNAPGCSVARRNGRSPSPASARSAQTSHRSR